MIHRENIMWAVLVGMFYILFTLATLRDATGETEVVDTQQAELTGDWTASAQASGSWGTNYLHDGNADKGTKTATYRAPEPGAWDVAVWYPAAANRAANVPVVVNGRTNRVDQRANGSRWLPVGVGDSATIGTEGTVGYVIADAVRFSRPDTLPPTTNRVGRVSLAWTFYTYQYPATQQQATVYWGLESRIYQHNSGPLAFGRDTYIVSNLDARSTWYFAVTAMPSNGVETGYSEELVWDNLQPPVAWITGWEVE